MGRNFPATVVHVGSAFFREWAMQEVVNTRVALAPGARLGHSRNITLALVLGVYRDRHAGHHAMASHASAAAKEAAPEVRLHCSARGWRKREPPVVRAWPLLRSLTEKTAIPR